MTAFAAYERKWCVVPLALALAWRPRVCTPRSTRKLSSASSRSASMRGDHFPRRYPHGPARMLGC